MGNIVRKLINYQEKYLLTQLIVIAFLSQCLAGFTNSSFFDKPVKGSINPSYEAGSFFLINTTEKKFLFQAQFYMAFAVNQTWNLTIHVNNTSTSSVRFNQYRPHSPWLVGKQDFTVIPSETQIELYTTIYMCDAVSLFNFEYYLVNSTLNASGCYVFQKIESGWYCNHGTSCCSKPTTTTLTPRERAASFFLYFGIFSLEIIFFLCIRRIRKKV